MAFGKNLKNLGKGADLTHPRASLGWFLPAVIAIVVIAAAIGVGLWIYGVVSAPVKSVIGNAPVIGGMVTGNQAATVDGSGWLN